jgi:hypothetical protein
MDAAFTGDTTFSIVISCKIPAGKCHRRAGSREGPFLIGGGGVERKPSAYVQQYSFPIK